MKIIESRIQAKSYIINLKANRKTIGFVPTLGGLHKGHQYLIQKARAENDVTILSIFLNPMQFRQKQFSEYPSNLTQDKFVAAESSVDMLFCPTVLEMYPYVAKIEDFFNFQTTEFKSRHNDNFVIEARNDNGIDNLVRVPANLVNQLDGKLHPWSFDGSATIVYKLCKFLQPHKAYFGEKDIQQLAILTKLIDSFFPIIKIVGVPTLRETDNLAFSSRNVLLSEKHRQAALCVYSALKHGENLIKEGEFNASVVLEEIKAIIAKQPLVTVDYLDIVSKTLLKPVTNINDDVVLYVAFFINAIRLTDTIIVRN